MRPRDLALVALINLVWGMNNVAVKLSVMAVEPVTASLLRLGVAGALTLPWLRWIPGRMGAILFIAMGQGAAHFALLNLAFARSDNPAALSLVTQLGAPITLILAVLFLGERIRWPRIAAILLAFVGVALIGFDPRLLGEREALWLMILAITLYASASVMVRRLAGVRAVTIFAWVMVASVPPLAVASLVFEPGALAGVPSLSFAELTPVIYSALGASLIGHLGLTWLTQRYPLSTVSPMFLPSPVIGATVATIVFGTPVTWTLIVGGLLVLLGVGVIALRTARVETTRTQL